MGWNVISGCSFISVFPLVSVFSLDIYSHRRSTATTRYRHKQTFQSLLQQKLKLSSGTSASSSQFADPMLQQQMQEAGTSIRLIHRPDGVYLIADLYAIFLAFRDSSFFEICI